jgi:GntR family transcriptional regulator
LGAGSDLPSIRRFAREHHISVITVQRAYEGLEREGLIHSRRGKGFFVSEIADKTRKVMAKEKLRGSLKPRMEEAMAEGLSKTEIEDVVQTLLEDGKPKK